MRTGLIKILRDIWLYKGRTILTMAGILIGIASVGSVLSAYSIMSREMNRNFMDTNPASIILNVSDLDQSAVDLINKNYGNLDIEIKKTAQARIGRGDGTYGTIFLRAIQDFDTQKVDTFTLERGIYPLKPSEMVLERDCLKILGNLKEGMNETVQIRLPGGSQSDIRITGIVHAPGLAPASMENYSYGFVTLDTLQNLGSKGWYDEMRIVSHDNRFNRDKMKELSQEIKVLLFDNGFDVSTVTVPEPGKHPHGDQLAALLFLLQAFAVIALLVACLIVINLLNFIMSRQARQIAVMKALGASKSQIALPYLFYINIISIGALILSFPLSTAAARGYAEFAAGILNFEISSFSVPAWVFIAQVLTGILIPLISAAYPVYKSSSQSVKDGLRKIESMAPTDKKATKKRLIAGINSKILMPVNNLIRKKTRTILAIAALGAGGALFMTSLNMVASINKTVDTSFQSFRWDYEISLSGNYPEKKLDVVINGIEGLDSYEIWQRNTVLLKNNAGIDSNSYPVKIMPEDTSMVDFSVSGSNSIIINKALATEEKWLEPGMVISVEMGDKTENMTIAGIVNEVPAIPCVYMGREAYENLFECKSRQVILSRANTRDNMLQRQITKDIEEKFKASGIEISEDLNIYVFRKAFVDHLYVIVTFLSIIALLAVIVGGISIGSAMGISVSERKREIGVLRAVGAGSSQITAMISFEILIMGLLGWVVGAIVSYPISVYVGNYFGRIFLQANLQNVMSISGSFQWLAVSMAVAFISGLFPALKAAGTNLRDMLVYE